ncbi:MAG: SAM-dependent chlorinase/fluorinase [Desulfobacterales bacterium]|nr:SAM-dependent chlorinase/fluorinase [Desulfobacterales bacterium]
MKDLTCLQISEPYISDNSELVGKIISVDRFGNLITNITSKYLEKFCKSYIKESFEIRINENKITGLVESYASARPQAPLAIIGSRGY